MRLICCFCSFSYGDHRLDELFFQILVFCIGLCLKTALVSLGLVTVAYFQVHQVNQPSPCRIISIIESFENDPWDSTRLEFSKFCRR